MNLLTILQWISIFALWFAIFRSWAYQRARRRMNLENREGFFELPNGIRVHRTFHAVDATGLSEMQIQIAVDAGMTAFEEKIRELREQRHA